MLVLQVPNYKAEEPLTNILHKLWSYGTNPIQKLIIFHGLWAKGIQNSDLQIMLHGMVQFKKYMEWYSPI